MATTPDYRGAATVVIGALAIYSPGSPEWTRMADALEWLTTCAELTEAGQPPLTH